MPLSTNKTKGGVAGEIKTDKPITSLGDANLANVRGNDDDGSFVEWNNCPVASGQSPGPFAVKLRKTIPRTETNAGPGSKTHVANYGNSIGNYRAKLRKTSHPEVGAGSSREDAVAEEVPRANDVGSHGEPANKESRHTKKLTWRERQELLKARQQRQEEEASSQKEQDEATEPKTTESMHTKKLTWRERQELLRAKQQQAQAKAMAQKEQRESTEPKKLTWRERQELLKARQQRAEEEASTEKDQEQATAEKMPAHREGQGSPEVQQQQLLPTKENTQDNSKKMSTAPLNQQQAEVNGIMKGKSIDERRREELMAIMKQKSINKEERANKIQELKQKYAKKACTQASLDASSEEQHDHQKHVTITAAEENRPQNNAAPEIAADEDKGSTEPTPPPSPAMHHSPALISENVDDKKVKLERENFKYNGGDGVDGVPQLPTYISEGEEGGGESSRLSCFATATKVEGYGCSKDTVSYDGSEIHSAVDEEVVSQDAATYGVQTDTETAKCENEGLLSEITGMTESEYPNHHALQLDATMGKAMVSTTPTAKERSDAVLIFDSELLIDEDAGHAIDRDGETARMKLSSHEHLDLDHLTTEETSSKNSSKLSKEVVLREESLEYNRSLLEKKEAMRKKKKKLELDQNGIEPNFVTRHGDRPSGGSVLDATRNLPKSLVDEESAATWKGSCLAEIDKTLDHAAKEMSECDVVVLVGDSNSNAQAQKKLSTDEENCVLDDSTEETLPETSSPIHGSDSLPRYNNRPFSGPLSKLPVGQKSALTSEDLYLPKQGLPKCNLGTNEVHPGTCAKCRYLPLKTALAIGVAAIAVVVAWKVLMDGGEGQAAPTTDSASFASNTSDDQLDTAPFPYAKPTARYEPFQHLDLTSQIIVKEELGYMSTTWNTHGLADIEQKGWNELTPNERNGATLLGFTAVIWDCFIHHYDSYSWDELSDEAVQAYQALGWSQAHWEGTILDSPSTESKWWDLLTENEKRGANALCLFKDNWDNIDMNPNPGYFPHPVPTFRYAPWDELGAVTRQVATSMMGYTEESWNGFGSADVEENTFLDLQPIARAGAMDLGFYTHTWDCFVSHYLSYHWSSFHGDLKLAVETLGWDEAMWTADSDEVPESENIKWIDLTPEEKAAATRLCYFEEIWDGTHISWWFDYDAGKNTAVTSDGPLPWDVNLHIFDETKYAGTDVVSLGG